MRGSTNTTRRPALAALAMQKDWNWTGASIEDRLVQARLGRRAVGQILSVVVRVRLGFRRGRQVQDGEVFHGQQPVRVDQAVGQLMVNVRSLVAHLAMGTGQGDGRSFPTMRPLCAAVLHLGELLDALEPFTVVARVLDVLAGRKRGEVPDAQVQPHRCV